MKRILEVDIISSMNCINTCLLYRLSLWQERDCMVMNFSRIKFISLISLVYLIYFLFCEMFKYLHISKKGQPSYLISYIVSFVDYKIVHFVMFVLVLFTSLALANWVLKTKISRFLIG